MAKMHSERGASTFGCLSVLICVVFIVFAVIMSFRDDPFEPLKPHLSQYTNIPKLKDSRQLPYIVGRAITIDKRKGKIDRKMYSLLPEGLRAKSPDEVETVFWVTRGEYVAGTYKTGSKGYVKTLHITIIDKANVLIVGGRTFSGSEPPPIKAGTRDWHGSEPTDKEIKKYIEGLPRLPSRRGASAKQE